MTALVLATICLCGEAPERARDFFWENDRTGYRAYGPGDSRKWSGIDVFNKNCRTNLVVHFLSKEGQKLNWHKNVGGLGMDDYAVGPGRGVGGVARRKNGVWLPDHGDWVRQKVVANSDERCAFELVYKLPEGGEMTLAVELKAGSPFFREAISFSADADLDGVEVGAGLDLNAAREHVGDLQVDEAKAIVSLFEKPHGRPGEEGSMMNAVFAAPGQDVVLADEPNGAKMVMTRPLGKAANDGSPVLVVYAGADWTEAGFNRTAADWHRAVRDFRAALERIPVVITVDDGLRTGLTIMAPALERRGWRGTFNIVTDKIGKPAYLTWDDVRELVRRGHSVTTHTKSHLDLGKLAREGRTDVVRAEIADSAERIASETGVRPRYLCLPWGSGGPLVDEIAASCGLETFAVRREVCGKCSPAGTDQGPRARILSRIADGERAVDLMIHGVTSAGGGYEAFETVADFEAFLDEVASCTSAAVADYRTAQEAVKRKGGKQAAPPATPQETALRARLPGIFAKSAAHYLALDAAATPLAESAVDLKEGRESTRKQAPHGFNRKTGKLDMRSIFWWTAGHFPGSLWYLYEATGDVRLRDRALFWTERLAPNRTADTNHDVGFIVYCSFGNARRILKTDRYDGLLVETAASLSKRFNPELGLIRSWGAMDEKKNFLVIPDNMMNLELLEAASKISGDGRYASVARSHANVTMKHHFRPDGGAYHVLNYDQRPGFAGCVQEIRRGQGLSCETTWSRGQSWAIYGYTMMYRETRDPAYLALAQKAADYAISHPNMPEDGVPCWDYGAPGEERDSSAASCMASALLELSTFVPGGEGARYRAFAARQLSSLASPEYFSEGGEIGHFLLKHGTGHKPAGSEVDTPLDYGDYYFLEALVRLGDLAGDSGN